jgi:hypothetical protein
VIGPPVRDGPPDHGPRSRESWLLPLLTVAAHILTRVLTQNHISEVADIRNTEDTGGWHTLRKLEWSPGGI